VSLAVLTSCNSVPSGGSDVEEEEDDDAGTMELDGADAEEVEEEELDEVARAKAVAKALAKGSSQVDNVADELHELNMDAYDDEEEGVRFSSSCCRFFFKSDQVLADC
jgi:periodic tryptophan protein 1